MVTHFCDIGPDARELQETFLRFLGTGRFRTMAEIGAYFPGLELVDPGLVPLSLWRPDAPVAQPLSVLRRLMAGGVGRKP